MTTPIAHTRMAPAAGEGGSGPADALGELAAEGLRTIGDSLSAGVYRHSRLVRVTHWINALAFLLLIPSGALVVWAHPEFYWGETGYFGEPAWLRLGLEPNFHLAPLGRNLHFLAAWILVLNGAVYLISGTLTRHFRDKMLPQRHQLAWRHLLQEVREHARLRHATGAASLEYNVLQKIAYLVVLFGLVPLMLLTGLSMSPGVTAAVPELFWLWGRQTARSIHLLCAGALVAFLVVHIVQVFVAGVRNEIRSMITGRFVPPPPRPDR